MRNTIRLTAIAAALLQAGTGFAAELEEVVVTAQFRQQSLQDAGLAIDAFSAKNLEKNGITNAYDLSQLTPALTIVEGGGIGSQLYMRGIGNQANNDYLDPAIIMTYDGVPMARGNGAAIRAFYDLERVEVLKGPQGTLYGKNATGGVVNLIPVKPQLGETSGFISGSAGNYDAYQLTGAVNVAIGDKNALRFSGSMNEHDGYNKDGTNDEDSKAYRIQFLSEVTDDLSVRLAMDYSDIGGVGGGTTPMGRYARTGLASFAFIPSGISPDEGSDTPASNAYRSTILAAPGFGFLTPIQDEWFTDAEMKGFNAEIRYDTGIGEFTLIPSWRKTEQESLFGHPGFNSGWWNAESEQKSVELRLSGGTEGIIQEYLVGAYYFDEEVKGNNTFNQEFVLPLQDYKQDGDSKAVFGQLTWKLSDTMRLITGARYTDDQKELDGSIDNYITFCGGIGPNLVTPPASFALGCQIPGNLPRFPTLDTPAQTDAFLIENGWAAAFIPIPPGFLIPLTTGKGQILHAISRADTEYEKQKDTYRISLEMDLADDSLVYVSFETGYRAGGLEPTGSTYKPEFLDAYTIGTKNRFFDGRVQLNAEVFYWDYTDQQISYFNLNEDGVLQNTTENVGAATSQGVDVDALWLATDNTLISAKIQYLDASYDDLHFLSTIPRDNINCPYSIYGVNEEGDPLLDFNCSDNDAIYSPEWTVILGVEQTIPLGGMDMIVSLDTKWVDDQVTGFTNLPHDTIDSYWSTNVDVTLASADNTWSVSAYARNIEDEERLQSSQSPLLGMAMGVYGPDMTYGARVRYNF